MHSEFPPKFGDDMWCSHITFMQKYLWPLEVLSSTPTFPIWSSRHFCTTTHLNISLKILPSVWRCQWMPTIQLYGKTQWCSLKNLSESSSFPFWSNLRFCTVTTFLVAPWSMIPFPTCSPPCQTLKSRRVDPLDDSKCLQQCHFLCVQNCSSAKLALASLCFGQTNLTTLLFI